jgi:hypothetical protein
MPLPCPGPAQISLVDIQNEFGGSNPIGLNEYYRNGGLVPSNNTNVPTSGSISLGDFFCASSPSIGDAYLGGFFAGYISHTANSVATHGLIVAPAATGSATRRLKTTTTRDSGAESNFNGSVNTANTDNLAHPAAQFCAGLSIDGYSDWYLPARFELDIAYYNLKPTTTSNSRLWGINDYSVPKRTVNNTSGNPARTSIAVFQSGGPEAFPSEEIWSSTQHPTDSDTWTVLFTTGSQRDRLKTDIRPVRAFRKFAL